MNVIREIQRLNEEELKLGIAGTDASWHAKYKDSAYIFIGGVLRVCASSQFSKRPRCTGLPYELNEGDIIQAFSQ